MQRNLLNPQLTAGEVRAMSNLGLAHMGDGFFELLVRSWLCCQGKTTAGNLHRKAVSYVCASAQSRFMEVAEPLLTEEETAVYRRGRNAHVHGVPKNATAKEYSRATGLECLFGYWFLTGQTGRANALFCRIMEELYGV